MSKASGAAEPSRVFDNDAIRKEGDAFLDADDFAQAARCYLDVVAHSPADRKALTSLGFIRMQEGRRDEAIAHLNQAVTLEPRGHDAHYMLGILHEANGELSLALRHLTCAVEQAPEFDLAVRDLSRVLFKQGKSTEARIVLEAAIARNPRFADYHFYLGNLQLTAGQPKTAAASYEEAVAIDAGHVNALAQLGIALDRSEEHEASVIAFRQALAIDPGHAPAHSGLGNVHLRLGQLEPAVACYQAALAADPTHAEAAGCLANVLRAQGKLEQALQACRRAVAANPELAGAHNNLGNALVELERPVEALPCYERAIALQPDLADALVNMGHALNVLKRPKDAVVAYERARAIDPSAPWLSGALLHTRMRMCDWRGIDAAFADLGSRVDRGERAATPFTMLGAPLTAGQQQRAALTYVQSMPFPETQPLPDQGPHERIRLGYFSADFHDHATAYLMAELFERHDRSRFEVIAFSFGPHSRHPMRGRLEAAFDRFVDVAHLSDTTIAERARAMPIDIAIDLKGFTASCRTGIFARRAAPIQVNYIGYPGTMGAPFIDYLLADSTVVASEDWSAYTEKIAFLPHSYQVNDSKRQILDRVFTRLEVGLPARGFVFCCFNNNYKITPDVFDLWMRLLRAIPGSVLWLLEDNAHAAANLKAEAVARGVAEDRLIFAPRVDMPEHLARQRLADLFLDTRYYNAHTTASDALWAGLPVLSCMGNTFASRVAASLLRAAGLAELVVETPSEYEQLALALATDPERLAELRRRLAENRLSCPLFDAALFARHAEAAYVAMWQRHRDGLPPDHIHIAP